MGFPLRLSKTSALGAVDKSRTSSCMYRCGCGQSLSDGAFLDWGSFCFRKGRFSIVTTLFVTLAFIWYDEPIQVAIIICILFIILFVF